MRARAFLPLLIFTALVVVFALLMMRRMTGDFDPLALQSALVGQPVPEFQLQSLDSAALSRAQLPNGPYLLNVWATWCISCKAEHGFLNQLREAGIKIVGLNYKDERVAALQWLERLGDPYILNIADPDGSLGLDLGVSGAPETFIVDASGVIRHRVEGPLNERRWRKEVQPIGLAW